MLFKSGENKQQKIEQQFLDDLLTDIELKSKRPVSKAKPSFKPSSLKCQRQCFFSFMGVEKDDVNYNDYSMIGIAENGTDRHNRLQNAIINSDNIEYINISKYIIDNKLTHLKVIGNYGNEYLVFDSRYNLRLMVDGIVKYKNQLFILEIKTEVSFKYDAHNEVHKEHYNQAICYSLAFGIDKVLFIYENRDILTKKSYLLEITPLMRQSVIDFMSEVNIAVKDNKMPPKPELASGTFCQYCEYKKACRGVKL